MAGYRDDLLAATWRAEALELEVVDLEVARRRDRRRIAELERALSARDAAARGSPVPPPRAAGSGRGRRAARILRGLAVAGLGLCTVVTAVESGHPVFLLAAIPTTLLGLWVVVEAIGAAWRARRASATPPFPASPPEAEALRAPAIWGTWFD